MPWSNWINYKISLFISLYICSDIYIYIYIYLVVFISLNIGENKYISVSISVTQFNACIRYVTHTQCMSKWKNDFVEKDYAMFDNIAFINQECFWWIYNYRLTQNNVLWYVVSVKRSVITLMYLSSSSILFISMLLMLLFSET